MDERVWCGRTGLGCSPDLNPIEQLWDELEQRLGARPSRPTSLSDSLVISTNTEMRLVTEDYPLPFRVLHDSLADTIAVFGDVNVVLRVVVVTEMASMGVLESILPDDAFEDSIKCKKKKKKSKKEKKAKLERKKRQKGQQCLKDDVESVTFTQIPKIKKRKKKKNDIRLQEEIPLLLTQPKKPSLSKRHKKPKDISQAVHNSTVQLDKQEPKKATLDESSTRQEHVRHKRRVMFNLSPEKILPNSHPFACRHMLQTQSSADTLPSLHTLPSGSHSQPLVKENAEESQSTPEDINSQDLFITQKTFSEPYADISSTPSSDDMAAVPPYQKSKESRTSSQERPSCKQLAEASTQTENFFTSPRLATSLSFRHQSTASTFIGEPMDLSLPNRSRLEVGLRGWSGKPTQDQIRPELKTTDMTSSDESDILTKTKADFAHLKVVQTRLNESFFFKVKGERESPRPRSPLMVLTGGFDKKSKNHVYFILSEQKEEEVFILGLDDIFNVPDINPGSKGIFSCTVWYPGTTVLFDSLESATVDLILSLHPSAVEKAAGVKRPCGALASFETQDSAGSRAHCDTALGVMAYQAIITSSDAAHTPGDDTS
ncbi:hypothetical protein NFI96_003247 [Prochilodus magdalenae]|nr:hypothetical protein NFI96_003247 [Prochilodus magdalenae]